MTLASHHIDGWGHIVECDAHDLLECSAKNFPLLNEKNHRAALMPRKTKVKNHYDMDMRQTRALLAEGWTDGAKVIYDMAHKMQARLPIPKDLRRRIRYGNTGDEIRVNRMLAGQYTDLWKSRKRQHVVSQPVITIAAHYCSLWSAPTEQIVSGGLAAALAYILEEYGYRCEILGINTEAPDYFATMGAGSRKRRRYNYDNSESAKSHYDDGADDHTHVAVVRLKAAHDPMNVETIAAALHPAVTHTLLPATMAKTAPRHICSQSDCNDTASRFATEWQAHGGKRIDYCFDYATTWSAQEHLRKAVLALGGKVFNQGDLTELENMGSLY